ncbi:MAG: hypothetical protein ACXVKL_14820 [Candidatus Angelobacter sp.]
MAVFSVFFEQQPFPPWPQLLPQHAAAVFSLLQLSLPQFSLQQEAAALPLSFLMQDLASLPLQQDIVSLPEAISLLSFAFMS